MRLYGSTNVRAWPAVAYGLNGGHVCDDSAAEGDMRKFVATFQHWSSNVINLVYVRNVRLNEN